MKKSEIENRTNFDIIRYSQCWEDADILLKGLDLKENSTILSIASAGDNSFSLLTTNPKKIIAIDLSKPQIAVCELRKACYKHLTYEEFIKFSGIMNNSTPYERDLIYHKISDYLPQWVQEYFMSNYQYIIDGFMTVGKFENYFKLFREKVLPLIHTEARVNNLLKNRTKEEQIIYYNEVWNNTRWKSLFKIFFSKYVMGKLGRDPEFYKYVTKSCSKTIFAHTEFALKNINNHTNPYLNFILKGYYNDDCLPHALRKENFEIIKNNIEKIEFKICSVEEALNSTSDNFDAYNLSDIFEYMSENSMKELYSNIINKSNNEAKVMYWNMLVPRQCPENLKTQIYVNKYICKKLIRKDKAFFYSKIVVEKIIKK